MRFDFKKVRCLKALLTVLPTAAAIFFTLPASAKSASASKRSTNIAVVDLKKVAAKSKAGAGIEEQAATQNNTSKKELIDLEDKIKSMESNKFSGSDPRKIEELQLLLYDMVKEKRFQISEAYRKAIEALESIIKEIIKEICAEKHLDIVVTSEAVIYFSGNCLDITEEVINRLNNRCEEIVLKLEEGSKGVSEDTAAKFAQ